MSSCSQMSKSKYSACFLRFMTPSMTSHYVTKQLHPALLLRQPPKFSREINVLMVDDVIDDVTLHK